MVALAANDVWAVGYVTLSGVSATLTEHWDGSAWTIVPSPNVAGESNFLNAVAATGAGDVWAVGYHQPGSQTRTLIQHWDGGVWTIVASPSPSTSDRLFSVAAISPAEAWASG